LRASSHQSIQLKKKPSNALTDVLAFLVILTLPLGQFLQWLSFQQEKPAGLIRDRLMEKTCFASQRLIDVATQAARLIVPAQHNSRITWRWLGFHNSCRNRSLAVNLKRQVFGHPSSGRFRGEENNKAQNHAKNDPRSETGLGGRGSW
jgi:hypothetical protein